MENIEQVTDTNEVNFDVDFVCPVCGRPDFKHKFELYDHLKSHFQEVKPEPKPTPSPARMKINGEKLLYFFLLLIAFIFIMPALLECVTVSARMMKTLKKALHN